jgi:hypothetical protein
VKRINHRTYLVAEDGLWRLPKGWSDEPRALPQYAGTRQRLVSVSWWEARESLECNFEPGSYISFDEFGNLDEDAALRSARDWFEAFGLETRARRMKVPDLRMLIQAKKLRAEWQLCEADLNRILADLIPTYDARHRRIPYVRPRSDSHGSTAKGKTTGETPPR